MIDWDKIKTPEDIFQYEDNLFDEAPDVASLQRDFINPNLTKEETEDADFWRNYRRGIWLLMAPPGQGKDMVATMIAYKFKKYFGFVPVLDYRPRRAFGAYVPFSEEMLVDQLDRMSEVSTGNVKLPIIPKGTPHNIREEQEIKREGLKSLIASGFKPHVTEDGRWISSRGEVFIRNAAIVLSEFDTNYMYRKEPNKPITRTLLRLFSRWRHLNAVIIAQGTEEANCHNQCFPKVTMRMTVRALDSEYPMFGLIMKPLRFTDARGGVLIQSGKVTVIPSIDGGLPRVGTGICEELGELAWKDLFNTDQATFMEPPKSMRRRQ